MADFFNILDGSSAWQQQLSAAAPAFNAEVLVGEVLVRVVMVTFAMTPGSLTARSVAVEIEDEPGGTFTVAASAQIPAGLTGTHHRPITFSVPPGHKYRFVQVTGADSTIHAYSYAELS